MSTHLCITVRWLDDRYHGLTEDKMRAEWPPSPFRLLQALVAGAHQHGLYNDLLPALQWLERQSAPNVLALHDPNQGTGYDHYVPDNDNQLRHSKPAVRIFKPVLLEGNAFVHYVWMIRPDDKPSMPKLDLLVSTLSTLGCGIDRAYASVREASLSEVDSELLNVVPLHRFAPVCKSQSVHGTLRTPKLGTLDDLRQVFHSNRVASTTLSERRKKRWPTVFDRFIYSGLAPHPQHPHVVFKLVDANEDTYRYPHAKLIDIAGMVRRLAIERMKADPPSWIKDSENWINRVVRGKKDEASAEEHRQFSYVPLPSIGHEHADALIRNVMIVAPLGMERELEFLAERLNGEALQIEGGADAHTVETQPLSSGSIELDRFQPARGTFIERCYLATADTWQTVTPILLPRNDDHKPKKTEKLIERALQQSGIGTPCEFSWQAIPFFKNTLSAHKPDAQGRRTAYFRPPYLERNTAVHLRIRFGRRRVASELESPWQPVVVSGPILIGAGRHCGLGLLAAAAP